MKLIAKTGFIVAAVLVSAAAHAQSFEPLTRAQVRADLMQLENAGYDPLNNCTGDCPGSLRHAQAILNRQQYDSNAGYGPVADGSAQSGR